MIAHTLVQAEILWTMVSVAMSLYLLFSLTPKVFECSSFVCALEGYIPLFFDIRLQFLLAFFAQVL